MVKQICRQLHHSTDWKPRKDLKRRAITGRTETSFQNSFQGLCVVVVPLQPHQASLHHGPIGTTNKPQPVSSSSPLGQ